MAGQSVQRTMACLKSFPSLCSRLSILNKTAFKCSSLVSKQHYCPTTKRQFSVTVSRFNKPDPRVAAFLKELHSKDSESREASDEFLSKLLTCEALRQCAGRFAEMEREKRELESLAAEGGDPELQKMATEELKRLEEQLVDITQTASNLIVPTRAFSLDGVIVEVTAGVGGQEAMLFCNELVDMYFSLAEFQGWEAHIIKFEKTELGGARQASISINSPDAYEVLKFEGGVHRVQRVPKTEKAGRIHTSTATVAILPRPSEVSIHIDPKDLKIETKRASGAGGQHVNTTESAVRIVHLPSGIAVECQTQRSQLQNRTVAMDNLRAKLFQIKIDEQAESTQNSRKLQVGSKARSEKIRTYNYPQDRITDHRINLTLHNIEEFIKGGPRLQNLLEQLQQESRKEQLEEFLRKYEK